MTTGKCLCGAVSFTATDVDPHSHACHCSMCRRWAGSPFMVTNVGEVTFEGEENIGRYESSDWGQRGFCKQCGSNLFYYFKPQDQYSMAVGAFEQQPFELGTEIYVDQKPEGYSFAGDHPRLTEKEFLASLGITTDG